MTTHTLLVLFFAGIACGAINAAAGGATLLGFPVLLSVGLPPSVANASNFIATMPGYAAAIPSYIGELNHIKSSAIVNIVSSIAGAVVGSILLVLSDADIFTKLIPYLLLTATLLYACSNRISQYFLHNSSLLNMRNVRVSNSILFLVCIYGGYFGAGLGIIMFSILRIIGFNDFHSANALKNVIITFVSLVSIGIFSSNALISWPEASIMMLGSAIGGYQCAKYAKRIPQHYLHNFVIGFGSLSTLYYFIVTP